MKLYEIDQQMEEMAEQLEPDAKTEEAKEQYEAALEALQETAGNREGMLTLLAKVALNAKEKAESAKAEEQRLASSRKKQEKKQDRMIAILDKLCEGKRTDLGVAVLCYKTTTRTKITDEGAAFAWLQEKGYEDCYKIPKPTVYKDSVGRLIDKGLEVPGAIRVTENCCYLEKTGAETPTEVSGEVPAKEPEAGGKGRKGLFGRKSK